MAKRDAVGELMKLVVLLEWGFGRRQVGVGITLSSRWGGGLRSSFGLIIGAAT